MVVQLIQLMVEVVERNGLGDGFRTKKKERRKTRVSKYCWHSLVNDGVPK
jgi:hypothetical protein